MNPKPPNLDASPEPPTRQRWLHGLVQRIHRWLIRRDISQAVKSTKDAAIGAACYSDKVCQHLDEAENQLRCARALMR